MIRQDESGDFSDRFFFDPKDYALVQRGFHIERLDQEVPRWAQDRTGAFQISPAQEKAIVAWSVANSHSDQPCSWSSSYDALFERPAEAIGAVWRICNKHARSRYDSANSKMRGQLVARDWLLGEEIPMPYESHVHKGFLLGDVLREAARTKVKNGHEKLLWLENKGVRLNDANRNKFL